MNSMVPGWKKLIVSEGREIWKQAIGHKQFVLKIHDRKKYVLDIMKCILKYFIWNSVVYMCFTLNSKDG